jgi:hypothetical protein
VPRASLALRLPFDEREGTHALRWAISNGQLKRSTIAHIDPCVAVPRPSFGSEPLKDYESTASGFNSDKWFREFTGTEAEARAFVISANLHRRHLSAQKKRELIALLLKANPERSDRAIAADVHVDHKTVAAVRHEGESSGDFPRFEKRTGADGKERKQPTLKLLPSPAPKSKPKAPAPSKATKPASLARDEEIVALVPMLHRHWVDIPALLAEAIPVAKRVAFVQSVAGKLGVSVTINGTLQ